MNWHLLAPGPSACQALADSLPRPLGVVTSAFRLRPDADFIAATDMAFWRAFPEAKDCAGRKFAIHQVPGVERILIPVRNSGAFALEVARRLGATRVYLHGFDMHGSHYFGPYTQAGLKNTTPKARAQHFGQFAKWREIYPHVEVINCTPGSALHCFPFEAWSYARVA